MNMLETSRHLSKQNNKQHFHLIKTWTNNALNEIYPSELNLKEFMVSKNCFMTD